MSGRIPQPSAEVLALMGFLIFLVFPARAQDTTVSLSGQKGKIYTSASTSEARTLTSTPDTSAAAKQTSESSSAIPSSLPAKPKPPIKPPAGKDWEARAIAGYHQAGASSAKFTQNFFFDFFIMRALSNHSLWDARCNWWGDVRIASAPQQVTAPVGTFVSNFTQQISNLPVNQLAQSADFQTGLERRLKTWDPDYARRMIGLVGFFGGMGTFEPPDTQMQIFNVPDPSSLQYPGFIKQFPSATNAKYVGFVPPNRERFYRSYGFGVRITTFDKDPDMDKDKDARLNPPATYTLTFGQDESITGGIFQSVVTKIDVFYPLSIPSTGEKLKVYLFGTVNLRLSKATSIPTFALQNPNANGVTVQPFDPNLVVITLPSTRDTYRIGAGIDLIRLFKAKP